MFMTFLLSILAKSLHALQIVRKIDSSCLRKEKTFEHKKRIFTPEVKESFVMMDGQTRMFLRLEMLLAHLGHWQLWQSARL